MASKAKEFVAYTELGGYKPGDVVDPAGWSADEWRYMVEHSVVVPKNSPDDPNVLAENAEESDTGEGDMRSPEERRMDAAMAAHEQATSSPKSDDSSEKSSEAPGASSDSKQSTPAKPAASPAKPSTPGK